MVKQGRERQSQCDMAVGPGVVEVDVPSCVWGEGKHLIKSMVCKCTAEITTNSTKHAGRHQYYILCFST